MISTQKADVAAEELLAQARAIARDAANRRARTVSFFYQSPALKILSRSEHSKALVHAERVVSRHKGFVAGTVATACVLLLLGFALLSGAASNSTSLLLALPGPYLLVLVVRTALIRREIARWLASGNASA